METKARLFGSGVYFILSSSFCQNEVYLTFGIRAYDDMYYLINKMLLTKRALVHHASRILIALFFPTSEIIPQNEPQVLSMALLLESDLILLYS